MERNDHDYFPHLPLLVIMHQHLFPICQLHLPKKDPLKCIFDISLSKNNTLSSSLRCILLIMQFTKISFPILHDSSNYIPSIVTYYIENK